MVALVLGFAGDYMGLSWKWLRPAAELLLLAELVVLVIIERRQLFEPVDEKVTNIESRIGHVGELLAAANFTDMHAVLGQLRGRSSGTLADSVGIADFFRPQT